MATERFHLCPKCGRKSWAGSLFDSLHAVALGNLHTCAQCATNMLLHLSFAWGLDAGAFQCVVLDAFLPDEPGMWPDKTGRKVTFYPFLVITEGKNGRVAWLPYWHVVRGKGQEQKKYGQWAPSMDLSTFEELVAKARAKGYLE